MNRHATRLLALLLAAALLLSACKSTESDNAEEESSSALESSAFETEPGPEELPPISGRGRYTREDVEQVPEMAEIHLTSAIEFSLSTYMWWAVKIDERGLRNEPDDFWPLDILVEYAWYVHTIENGTAPYSFDGHDYSIPRADIERMVRDAFTSETLPDVIRYHRSYNESTDSFSFQEYTGYYVDTLLEFDLEWEDAGNLRTVTMYEVRGNPTRDRKYTYLYERGDDGRWRLQNAIQEMREPADIDMEGAERIENDEHAAGIFGSIGTTVLSREYWDGELTLYALDWDDFSTKGTASFDEGPATLIPRGDRLFLNFERRIVVLDETLAAVYDAPLPKPLLDLMDREIEYESDEWGYQTPLQFFNGYDISPDLRSIAYATEEGLFLYNLATGSSTQLAASEIGSWPGSSKVIFSYYSPRFTADGAGLYTRLPVYEGPSDYYYFNFSANSGYSVKESSVFTLVSPSHSGMGSYFASFAWEWSYYFGENHYVVNDTYVQPNRFEEWKIGPITDTSETQSAPLISAPVDDAYYYQFITVLSDGRVILSASEAWEYSTRYFHTAAD